MNNGEETFSIAKNTQVLQIQIVHSITLIERWVLSIDVIFHGKSMKWERGKKKHEREK